MGRSLIKSKYGRTTTIALAGLIHLSQFVSGCGDSSDQSTLSSLILISSIASLPKASGPVSADPGQASQPTAKTGVLLKGFNFTVARSSGLTSVAANVQNAFLGVSLQDKILCHLGVAESVVNPTYDGSDHFYTIEGLGVGSSPVSLRANISKAGDSSINSFKLWTCQDGSQTSFINIANSSGTMTMTSVSTVGRASITGSFDAKNGWSSKEITAESRKGNTWYKNILVQSKKDLILKSASSSYWSAGVDNGFNTGTSYARIQLVNPSKLSTLALGDGSLKWMTFSNFASGNGSGEDSWLGDLGASISPNSLGIYFNETHAQDLKQPKAGGSSMDYLLNPFEVSVEEKWDCTAGTASTPIKIDVTPAIQSSYDDCDSTFGF
jgi:hypothetical protein